MNIFSKLRLKRQILPLIYSLLKSRRHFFFSHSNKFPPATTGSFITLTNLYFKRSYMDLASVIKIIEERIPPHLAESWDNTGLLIEPSNKTTISSILFTNDLTKTVLEEAVNMNSDLILSYHPPIFAPMKCLKNSNWKDNIVIRCIENAIAVYSPHTSCDAVSGGVNDWLINSFNLSHRYPIHSSYEHQAKYTHMVDFTTLTSNNVGHLIKEIPDSELCGISVLDDQQNFRIKVTKSSLNSLLKLLANFEDVSFSSISVISLHPLPIPSCGMGRIGKLAEPLALGECVKLVKTYLKLDFIRFSQSASHSLDSLISTVAVCAGSGSSVLKGVSADLYITGEMSHHDLLDANHRNISVILCEHSNSERGYLKHLVELLRPELSGIKLIISAADKDPVTIM